MPYVSQIFRQSNKLRNTNTANLVKLDHPVLARWFSNSSRSFVANGDHFPKLPQCGSVAGKGHGSNKSSVGFLTSSQRNNIHDVSKLRMQKNLDAPATRVVFNRLISCPQMQPRKCFSTSSDLPPHQEVGMPSLSPTMTEGNIARWLKKEGDKVSPGEVLCEIETDKATVEMECMEEGYLAKILKGAGSTGIQVGEVIAITVEEESDIGNFKDYTPSTSDATQKPARKEPSPSREAAQETASPAPTSSNPNLPPHQEVGMPSLSPTMTEGNIARWLKKEGDKVSPGEVLCEVETDKATVEMECMEEGYLAKILKGDGASGIQVGEVIAITVEEEDDIAKFKDYTPSTSDAGQKPAPKEPSPSNKAAQEPVTASPKPRTTSRTGSRIFASPLARKLAEQHNVSLSSIEGTGPDGRIVKADIEEYLASPRKEAPATGRGVETAPVGAINYVDIPHSQIRKVTASRLLLSKQTIPHYYLTVDTCVDKLIELRVLLNSLVEASGGKKISINDLVIKAAALALRKVPSVNSSWTNDYIRQYHNVNVNVAVQTENGLYVPVIRDADKKGLSTISEEVKHVAQKAKDNTLKPEDYEGGTFTVSNLGGPFGVKQFCAIVNPPQAAILAVGSAEKRVVPGLGTDQFKFASFMSVTLSCDHRVIDGAIGAEWLKAFKGYIENPESMML